MADVTMPKLSDTMEEGKILRWLKQAGDQVAVGDLLVEVETDKADMEVEASAAGVLREVKLGEGESAPVGAVIAVIDGAGGDAKPAAKTAEPSAKKEDAPPRPQAAAKEPAKAPEKRSAAKEAPGGKADADEGRSAKERQAAKPEAEAEPEPEDPAVPAAKPRPTSQPAAPRAAAAAAPRVATPARGGGVKASPLARALATELGVELSSVRGTGPAGRITRHDVEQAASAGKKEPARADAPPPPAAKPARATDAQAPAKAVADEPQRAADATSTDAEPSPATDAAQVRRVPLSKMRASIAKRMAESKREAPHFYLTTVVDMDEAVGLRAQLKALEVSRAGVTYNHMVLKAVAGALADHPEINARFAGDAIELDPAINLGIATAVEDGLIVPVLSGADRLSLLEIAERARALADKAESGRFSSADLSGATFSVSNLGMFDVDSFSAVINPPQAAILAVGSVKQRPVVRDGALAVGYTMAMTLSCDHRVIDGARGGRFLAEVKRRLENPVALLLDDEAGA
jgi:pyruvate dehydrogenase E2 component (dihydrolipoamide acetyltransferase)